MARTNRGEGVARIFFSAMPNLDLAGRVGLVTGGSRGIGFAIAEQLAGLGAKVVMSSRKQPELDQAVERINAQRQDAAVGIPAHAGKPTDIERLVSTTMERFKAIDILVVNAATNPFMGSIVDIELGAWDKVFEVNLRGALLLVQAVVKAWMYDHGGSIVTIASTAGLHPAPGLGAYGVSKAALIQLTKQLAMELGDRHIRVNAVAPGTVQTRFAEALWKDEGTGTELRHQIAMGRIGQPNEVANAVAFLASDAASYINGAVLTIDGGFVYA
jgi:NAD(P)-dependent dehydrogenase (short-subunit alcohol dehydrogenase family)